VLKRFCWFPLKVCISSYSLEKIIKSFLARLLLKKSCALTHIVLKQNKICGKKLLTLTDVQLQMNFLELDALLLPQRFIETLLLFDFVQSYFKPDNICL